MPHFLVHENANFGTLSELCTKIWYIKTQILVHENANFGTDI